MQSPSLTQRLASFLPFTSPPTPRPPSTQAAANGQATIENANQSIPSVPFTTKTVASALLPMSADGVILLQQDVEFTLVLHGPMIKLRLTLDLRTQTAVKTEIMEIASWASEELATCLELSSGPKDIAYLGTAIGQYTEVLNVRARCWNEVRLQFRNLLRDLPHPSDAATLQTGDLGCSSITLARSSVALEVKWHIFFWRRGRGAEPGVGNSQLSSHVGSRRSGRRAGQSRSRF